MTVKGETPVVSIVLPVFNEHENLAPLIAEIDSVFGGLSYEIVAVDDGSTDGSLRELSAPDLGVIAARAALECAGVNAGEVDLVLFSNSTPSLCSGFWPFAI